MKNAFTNIYEARYVSGVVAGLKLQELVETGELTQEKHPESFDGEGNIKVGYVGAYNYAEVVSGLYRFLPGNPQRDAQCGYGSELYQLLV